MSSFRTTDAFFDRLLAYRACIHKNIIHCILKISAAGIPCSIYNRGTKRSMGTRENLYRELEKLLKDVDSHLFEICLKADTL